jgi:plastocyanin
MVWQWSRHESGREWVGMMWGGRFVGRFVALAVVVALGCSLAPLAGCGGSPNQVQMGVADFEQHRITIQAGQAVHFVDPGIGGGVHILCVGHNLKCIAAPGVPPALDTPVGLTFNPGDPARDVVFATPGTYEVICTIHPGMVLMVTVR